MNQNWENAQLCDPLIKKKFKCYIIIFLSEKIYQSHILVYNRLIHCRKTPRLYDERFIESIFEVKVSSSLSSSRHAASTDSLDILSLTVPSLVSLLDGIECQYRADKDKLLLVNQHWGVHYEFFLVVSSLITRMVCEIGDKWPYNYCFVRCCSENLFTNQNSS